MTVAYCWRSGHVEFGRTVPDGAILIIRGPDELVRELVEPACRLAYDNKTLLVPGIPEADSDDAACKAAMSFICWIESRVRRRGLNRIQLDQADQVMQ